MNKSRLKQTKMSVIEISMLVVATIIVMVAGITHACLKNSHVELVRAMDKTQQCIEDHKDAANSLQVKIDKKLNIYQLRADLEQSGSALVTVPTSCIEKISAHTLAGELDRPSAIAAITP